MTDASSCRGSPPYVKRIVAKEVVVKWIKDLAAIGVNGSHVLVVQDLHSAYEYPELVFSTRDVLNKIRNYPRIGAEVVVEVYNLNIPLEPQLEQGERVWNL